MNEGTPEPRRRPARPRWVWISALAILLLFVWLVVVAIGLALYEDDVLGSIGAVLCAFGPLVVSLILQIAALFLRTRSG